MTEQVERAKRASGLVFVQVLAGEGEEILAISSWRTAKDLRAYAESPMASDFIARLTPLLIVPPTARSYEIKLNVEGTQSLFERDEGGEG